jgi:hypothetical protein
MATGTITVICGPIITMLLAATPTVRVNTRAALAMLKPGDDPGGAFGEV